MKVQISQLMSYLQQYWRQHWPKALATFGALILLLLFFWTGTYRFGFAQTEQAELMADIGKVGLTQAAVSKANSAMPTEKDNLAASGTNPAPLLAVDQGDYILLNIPQAVTLDSKTFASVYRRSTARGFTRINKEPIAGTEYQDFLTANISGQVDYLVMWLDGEGRMLAKSNLATIFKNKMVASSKKEDNNYDLKINL